MGLLVEGWMKGLEVELTELLEELVALIENEVLDGGSVESLVPDEGVESSRSSDDDVRALVLGLEDLDIVLDLGSSVEDRSSKVGHELGESSVLVLDLVGELSGVAENDDGDLSIDGLDLLKGGEDEDGGLSHSGLGLAEDVHSEDRLRNTLLLDCGSEGRGRRTLVRRPSQRKGRKGGAEETYLRKGARIRGRR